MKSVNVTAKVLNALGSNRVVTGGGVAHETLELEVGDESGTIRLTLWDDKALVVLKKDDIVKIENGFVTSFKGVWRINVGRYGTIAKV